MKWLVGKKIPNLFHNFYVCHPSLPNLPRASMLHSQKLEEKIQRSSSKGPLHDVFEAITP